MGMLMHYYIILCHWWNLEGGTALQMWIRRMDKAFVFPDQLATLVETQMHFISTLRMGWVKLPKIHVGLLYFAITFPKNVHNMKHVHILAVVPFLPSDLYRLLDKIDNDSKL